MNRPLRFVSVFVAVTAAFACASLLATGPTAIIESDKSTGRAEYYCWRFFSEAQGPHRYYIYDMNSSADYIPEQPGKACGTIVAAANELKILSAGRGITVTLYYPGSRSNRATPLTEEDITLLRSLEIAVIRQVEISRTQVSGNKQ